MNDQQIMYIYEHKVLPQYFYEMKDKFIMALVNGEEEFLHGFLKSLYENEKAECSCSKEQFGVKTGRLSEKLMLARIVFPTPQTAPLCYYAYLIFDAEFEKAKYFTLERGASEEEMFLCEWNKNGEHINYGTVAFHEEKIIKRCVAICSAEE